MVRMNHRARAERQTATERFHFLAARGARHLQVVHQIADADTQGFGNFQHGGQRSLHVATLDFANEVMMQVRLFRQFLLGEARSLAVAADFVAQQAPIIWFGWHLLSWKQEGRGAYTHYTVFYACIPFGKDLETSAACE